MHCIALNYINHINYINYIHTLHYITLHYITFHCIALHCIALHYITLHYITSHYITLYIHPCMHAYIPYIHALNQISIWTLTSSRSANVYPDQQSWKIRGHVQRSSAQMVWKCLENWRLGETIIGNHHRKPWFIPIIWIHLAIDIGSHLDTTGHKSWSSSGISGQNNLHLTMLTDLTASFFSKTQSYKSSILSSVFDDFDKCLMPKIWTGSPLNCSESGPCLDLIGDGNVLLKDGPNPGVLRSILKL